jgi:hypothetical protein
MAYYEAASHTASDGELHIRFTDDYGANWTAEDTKLGGGAVTGFPMWPTGAAPADPYSPVEPKLYMAPNGDLLIHMWKEDFATPAVGGTWQSVSADDGATWSAPAQITFAGAASNNRVFATDDGFISGSDIYIGGRAFSTDYEDDPEKCVFMKSTDNGTSWSHVADMCSTTDNALEVGMEYIGGTNIVAILRDHYSTGTDTYKVTSADMGATWSAVVDVKSRRLGIVGRPRIYTRAHIKGEASWWTDPVLIMTAFRQEVSGSSFPRRNGLWFSFDAGASWSEPYLIDTPGPDAGYSDILWDATNSRYVVVATQGTVDEAVVKQYNISITGLP